MHNFGFEKSMKMLKAINVAISSAVSAANCLGDKFFSLNM